MAEKLRQHPGKDQSKADIQLQPLGHRLRNLVERFFNRIKQMRGLVTRYDRRSDNYLAALKIAPTRIWIASGNESISWVAGDEFAAVIDPDHRGITGSFEDAFDSQNDHPLSNASNFYGNYKDYLFNGLPKYHIY